MTEITKDMERQKKKAKPSGDSSHIYLPKNWEGDEILAINLDSSQEGGENMKSVEIQVSDERFVDIRESVIELKDANDVKNISEYKSKLFDLITKCQLFSDMEAEVKVEDDKVSLLF